MRWFLIALFIASGSAVKADTDIPYAIRGNSKLHLDIHYPAEATRPPYPTLLWIHGGGWRNGSRQNWHLVDWLPEKGFAVVSIDYRLTGTAPFPAQIEDCVSALEWIGNNGERYNLDTDKIFTAGLSAGAHLATLLGTSGNHFAANKTELLTIRGILHFYGPCDFLSLMKYAKEPNDTLNTDKSPVFGLLGGPLRENETLAKEASPVTYLDGNDPPLLIFVGTNDSLMTQRQCKRLDDLARTTGIPSTIHTIKGAGHGGPEFKDLHRQQLILQFLRSQ